MVAVWFSSKTKKHRLANRLCVYFQKYGTEIAQSFYFEQSQHIRPLSNWYRNSISKAKTGVCLFLLFCSRFFYLDTNGNKAIWRARLIACANARWCFAHSPVRSRDLIFFETAVKRCKIAASFQLMSSRPQK